MKKRRFLRNARVLVLSGYRHVENLGYDETLIYSKVNKKRKEKEKK